MIKDLVPVILILGGLVYMYDLSIKKDEALFNEHINSHLENEKNIEMLEAVENSKNQQNELAESHQDDERVQEFIALLEDDKYLNKAIAIMNDKKAVEEQEMITARLQASKKIEGLENVEHDGDPETKKFKVLLDGTNSYDPENDDIELSWKQTGGKNVELSSVDGATTKFEGTAGTYSFSLSVTDAYGAVNVFEKEIQVGPELNQSPVAIYSAERE